MALLTFSANTWAQSKVYLTREISSASLLHIYEALGVKAKGRVAVKISTGEGSSPNYLKPEPIKDLVYEVDGTIVECNIAYADLNLTHFISRYPGAKDSPVYGAAQWITRGAATLALANNYRWGQGEASLFTDFGRHKIDDGSSDPEQPTKRFFRSRDNVMGISWWQALRYTRGDSSP